MDIFRSIIARRRTSSGIIVPDEPTGYEGAVPNNTTIFADYSSLVDPGAHPNLKWHSGGRQYIDGVQGMVLTESDDLQVAGASNGRAWEVTTRVPTAQERTGSNSDMDKVATRMELNFGDYPGSIGGAGGLGWTHRHLKMDTRVIYNYRFKIAQEWEVDTAVSGPEDRNTSLFEFKQDYGSGSGFMRRDATFRMRINGKKANFKMEGCTEYKKTLDTAGGLISDLKQVDVSQIFDNKWHQLTIDVLFSPSANGHIRVHLDSDPTPIYSLNGYNVWNDEAQYGPYFKFGQYNSWWRNNDTGSTKHRHLVDFIQVGIPK